MAGRARWPGRAVQLTMAAGGAPGLGNFERTAELADQKLRIIDLDRGQDARQLELQRGRALELEAGAAAAHLDAERIARDRLRRAVLLAPGLPLAVTPRGNLRLRAPGGVEPQRGPGDRQQHHQAERIRTTARAGGGGRRGVTGREASWRSCTAERGLPEPPRRPLLQARRLRRFNSHLPIPAFRC